MSDGGLDGASTIAGSSEVPSRNMSLLDAFGYGTTHQTTAHQAQRYQQQGHHHYNQHQQQQAPHGRNGATVVDMSISADGYASSDEGVPGLYAHHQQDHGRQHHTHTHGGGGRRTQPHLPVVTESTSAGRIDRMGSLAAPPSPISERASDGVADGAWADGCDGALPLDGYDEARLVAVEAVARPPSLGLFPHELADTQRLMRTITLLSTQVQRLTVQVEGLPPVPEAIVAGFDPIIAEGHLQRLSDQLAEQALLRAADARRADGLEEQLAAERRGSSLLRERIQALEKAVAGHVAGEEAVRAEGEAAAAWRAEVLRLRASEADAAREVNRLRGQLADGAVHIVDSRPAATTPTTTASASDPTCSTGTDAPASSAGRLERAFLEMDEAAARQDTLLDCLYAPLVTALDAGLAFVQAEAECRRQANEALRAEQDTSGHLQVEALVARSDGEALRHRVAFLDGHVARLERVVAREQAHGRALAAEHRRQIEALVADRTADRQRMLDAILPELEARLVQAYRDGREAAAAARADGSTTPPTSAKRYRRHRSKEGLLSKQDGLVPPAAADSTVTTVDGLSPTATAPAGRSPDTDHGPLEGRLEGMVRPKCLDMTSDTAHHSA